MIDSEYASTYNVDPMHFEGVRCPRCGNEDVSMYGPGNENYPPSFNCYHCDVYGHTFHVDTPAGWNASNSMRALSVANAERLRGEGTR